MAHTVLLHLAVPLEATQRLPHVLQFLASVVRSVSQPSAGSPLQSPLPPGHTVSPHTLFLHHGVPPWVGVQVVPHLPQFWTSRETSFSHPLARSLSQSPNPVSHVIWQADSAQ